MAGDDLTEAIDAIPSKMSFEHDGVTWLVTKVYPPSRCMTDHGGRLCQTIVSSGKYIASNGRRQFEFKSYGLSVSEIRYSFVNQIGVVPTVEV